MMIGGSHAIEHQRKVTMLNSNWIKWEEVASRLRGAASAQLDQSRRLVKYVSDVSAAALGCLLNVPAIEINC